MDEFIIWAWRNHKVGFIVVAVSVFTIIARIALMVEVAKFLFVLATAFVLTLVIAFVQWRIFLHSVRRFNFLIWQEQTNLQHIQVTL